jgi:hypothetical protein
MATTSSTTTTTAAPAETTTEAPPPETTTAAETTTETPATTTSAAAGAEPSIDEVTYAIDPDDGAAHNAHSVQISTDAKLTITWSTQNATAVRIDPLAGPFDASGSTELESKDANYSIVALGDGGAESQPYALEVHTHDPSEVVSSHTDVTSGVAKVLSFTASAGESAAPGASVDLSIVVSVDVESAKAADQDVELEDSGDGHKIGTVTVTIPGDGDASVTYTCEATQAGATADTATLTLAITASTTTTTASPSSTTTAPSTTTTAPATTTTAPATTTTIPAWDLGDFSVVLCDADGNPLEDGSGSSGTEKAS